MSVPVQVPISGPYTANGTTTQFAYQFYVLLATDLDVYVGGAKKVYGTDYSVTQVGNTQGGNVVFVTAPANGLEVIIKRNTPFSRTTDYADNGDLLADVLNDDIDRLWLALQEINANFGSSISRPVGGNWEADNLRLTQLADGTQPQDAVTYKQLYTVQGNASASAQAAAQSATDAGTYRTQAVNAASAANTSATDSSDSAALSRRWAAEVPDTVVANGLYSARHYASKGADSAASALQNKNTTDTNAAATAADRVQTGLDRSASSQSATAAAASAALAQQYQPNTALQIMPGYLADINAVPNNAPGLYSCNGSTANKPAGITVGGWLSHFGHNAASVYRQEYQTSTQGVQSNRKFFRVFDTGVWSGWVEIFTSISPTIFSPVNAATAPASGVTVNGGVVASKYQVAGADYSTAELRAQVTGGTTPARAAALDIGDGSTKATWLFDSTGKLTTPGTTALTLAQQLNFSTNADRRQSLVNMGVTGTGSKFTIPISTTQALCIINAGAVSAVNASGEGTLNYGQTFVNTPQVVMSNGNGNAGGQFTLSMINNPKVSGFDYRVRNNDGSPITSGNIQINYIAMGIIALGA